MKKLILVRHAKAELLPSNKTDFDRKLTSSGKDDAVSMAELLSKKITCPEVFISSTAKRAFSTCKRFAKAFEFDINLVVEQPKIYEASAQTLLDIVHDIDDHFQSAIMFGHNPGFTQLACYLSGDNYIEMPTCGVIVLNFKVEEWCRVDHQKGELLEFIKP
ncbi:MAG: SixA phosphatase family protein [Bacteroidota bacterium]|jgi:phosphohistidine phosphatase